MHDYFFHFSSGTFLFVQPHGDATIFLSLNKARIYCMAYVLSRQNACAHTMYIYNVWHETHFSLRETGLHVTYIIYVALVLRQIQYIMCTNSCFSCVYMYANTHTYEGTYVCIYIIFGFSLYSRKGMPGSTNRMGLLLLILSTMSTLQREERYSLNSWEPDCPNIALHHHTLLRKFPTMTWKWLAVQILTLPSSLEWKTRRMYLVHVHVLIHIEMQINTTQLTWFFKENVTASGRILTLPF